VSCRREKWWNSARWRFWFLGESSWTFADWIEVNFSVPQLPVQCSSMYELMWKEVYFVTVRVRRPKMLCERLFQDFKQRLGISVGSCFVIYAEDATENCLGGEDIITFLGVLMWQFTQLTCSCQLLWQYVATYVTSQSTPITKSRSLYTCKCTMKYEIAYTCCPTAIPVICNATLVIPEATADVTFKGSFFFVDIIAICLR